MKTILKRQSQFGVSMRRCVGLLLALGVSLAVCGCQELTYSGPNGERFSRRCLGTTTSFGLLNIEPTTNGLPRVQLQGYQNDGTQSLGVVTEAAVRAALQSAAK